MKVTMVKKRLADGSECRKCLESTDFLKKKGLWEQVDEVVWFDESQPDSAGALLTAEHAMERAPFFVIERPGRPIQAIESVMRVYRLL